MIAENKRSIWGGIMGFFSLVAMCFLLLMVIGIWLDKRSQIGPDKIAVIRIEGVIEDSRDVLEQLEEYNENDTVKAIVLRIDTPGGGVGPSQEIYQSVKDITKEGRKKVIVSMGGVAASGGYYIASAADKIVANPGTITGSIGVLMEFANIEELFNKIGLKATVMKTGAHKDIGSPVREMTPEDKAVIQELLDDVYDQFVEAVASGRKLEVEQVKKIADGRIFSGQKAKDLGLVDEIGNMPFTLELAADMVGIKERPLEVLEEDKESPFNRFMKSCLNLDFGASLRKINTTAEYRWNPVN